MTTIEEWRSVESCPAYEVSSEGRIRRALAGSGAQAGHIMRPEPRPVYLCVTMCQNGQRMRMNVHRIVAFAFLGPPPTPKHEVAHNDGNKHNNRASNLRWATRKENIADQYLHGVRPMGERSGGAKLTAKKVIAIRDRYARGEGIKSIAPSFGICEGQVWAVAVGKSWRHAGGPISPVRVHRKADSNRG